MQLFLVGVQMDDGKLDHIRVFSSTTWALKYGRSHGNASRYATVEVDFGVTPPQPKGQNNGQEEKQEG